MFLVLVIKGPTYPHTHEKCTWAGALNSHLLGLFEVEELFVAVHGADAT